MFRYTLKKLLIGFLSLLLMEVMCYITFALLFLIWGGLACLLF